MYIIDGHNLIGKLSSLSLSDPDDERRLVDRLQIFARMRRKLVEVYFDGAPPGQAGTRSVGMIRVHFVPQGVTADSAISARLAELGRRARNCTVVSSDRKVQMDARHRQASIIPSERFAIELDQAQSAAEAQPAESKGARDLEVFYDIFGIDPDQAEKPIEPPPIQPERSASSTKKRARHGFESKKK